MFNSGREKIISEKKNIPHFREQVFTSKNCHREPPVQRKKTRKQKASNDLELNVMFNAITHLD